MDSYAPAGARKIKTCTNTDTDTDTDTHTHTHTRTDTHTYIHTHNTLLALMMRNAASDAAPREEGRLVGLTKA